MSTLSCFMRGILGDSRGKVSGAPQPLNLTQSLQPWRQVPRFSTMARSLSEPLRLELQKSRIRAVLSWQVSVWVGTSLHSPSCLSLTHSCISLLDVSHSNPFCLTLSFVLYVITPIPLSLHLDNLFYQLAFLFLFLVFHFSYLPSLFFYSHHFMTFYFSFLLPCPILSPSFHSLSTCLSPFF